jgi:hypothetical protein
MFIGELGIAFLVKKKYKSVPMWLLFLGSMFSNILMYVFVFFGIERVSYVRNTGGIMNVLYDFVPYSLSLFSAIVLGLLCFLIFSSEKRDEWGLGMASVAVLSWIPKVLFHGNKIPLLWDNITKIGLTSWDYPVLLFCFELLFIAFGFLILFGTEKKSFGLKPILSSVAICILVTLLMRFSFPAGERSGAVVVFEFLITALFLTLTFLLEKKQKIHGKRVFWSEKEDVIA